MRALILAFYFSLIPALASAAILQGNVANCDGAAPSTWSSAACKNSVSSEPLHVLTFDGYTECVYVDNASTKTFYIPFHTKNEWDRFKAVAPSLALTLRPPVWTVNSTGSCSASCGGGTQTVNWVNGCGDKMVTQQSCNTQACETTTTDPSQGCTASGIVNDAYTRNLGRCPDQSGAAYWQGRVNALTAQGLSGSALSAALDHEMSGTAEAINYGLTGTSDINVGFASNGYSDAANAQTVTMCTSGTNCTGTDYTQPNTGASVDGWNNISNVIATSYSQNGIADRLNSAAVSYWTDQYNQAVARGRTPDEAAQDVRNAITAAK